jgi:hypothetical protein
LRQVWRSPIQATHDLEFPSADKVDPFLLRVLTIFDGLIFKLFEVRFPFRFPHAVGENGKRNWELDGRRRVVSRRTDERDIKGG